MQLVLVTPYSNALIWMPTCPLILQHHFLCHCCIKSHGKYRGMNMRFFCSVCAICASLQKTLIEIENASVEAQAWDILSMDHGIRYLENYNFQFFPLVFPPILIKCPICFFGTIDQSFLACIIFSIYELKHSQVGSCLIPLNVILLTKLFIIFNQI